MEVMGEWQTEAGPVLEGLTETCRRFLDSYGNATATVAACDELAAAARDASRWYLERPCPLAAARPHFVGIIANCRDIAAEVHRGLGNPATDWYAVHGRIQGHARKATDHSRRLAELCS